MNTQHLNKEQKVSKLYFIAGRYKNVNNILVEKIIVRRKPSSYLNN